MASNASHYYMTLNTDHVLVKLGWWMQHDSVSYTKAVSCQHHYTGLHLCSVARIFWIFCCIMHLWFYTALHELFHSK